MDKEEKFDIMMNALFQVTEGEIRIVKKAGMDKPEVHTKGLPPVIAGYCAMFGASYLQARGIWETRELIDLTKKDELIESISEMYCKGIKEFLEDLGKEEEEDEEEGEEAEGEEE